MKVIERAAINYTFFIRTSKFWSRLVVLIEKTVIIKIHNPRGFDTL